MTLQEMKKQKEILEKQIIQQEELERSERQNAVISKIEKMTDEEKNILLNLVKHDRTSCSDEYPSNGYGSASYGARCNKCFLIEILNGEHGGRFDFSIDLNIWEV